VNSTRCNTNVTIQFNGATDAIAGLDGYSALFDGSPSTVAPTSVNLSALASSYSGTLTPDTGAYYMHIRPVDKSGNWGITQHYGPFFIGTSGQFNYCQGAPNSVGGTGGFISASGSLSVSDNSFTLIAQLLPPDQPSLFFFGPFQAQIPFGNGFRCVGGTIVRLPVVYTGGGTAAYTMDLTAPPASSFIDAHETWYFQNWYRDPAAGGAFFNLTNGLGVTFCE